MNSSFVHLAYTKGMDKIYVPFPVPVAHSPQRGNPLDKGWDLQKHPRQHLCIGIQLFTGDIFRILNWHDQAGMLLQASMTGFEGCLCQLHRMEQGLTQGRRPRPPCRIQSSTGGPTLSCLCPKTSSLPRRFLI